MKIHRFIGNFNLASKTIEIADPEIIRQISLVLKLVPGEKIVLSDGYGTSAEVTLEAVLKNKVLGTVGKIIPPEEIGGEVSLYLSILKKEKFELGVQKAVEAGVSSIIPIITERTIKTGLNFERLEKIIREASEQAGRSVVPRLHPITNFEDAITDGKKADYKMIFHPAGNFYKPKKISGTVSIFIGPEGGFTDKEIKNAADNGYEAFSLGPLVLRAETAAMIAVYRTSNGI